MNMLNSVILEGVVSEGLNEDGVFTTCSSRYSKVGEGLVEEKTFVKCIVEGRSRTHVSDKLNEGRGVRIVGRLKEIEGNLGLFAEHIEVKPLGVKKEGKYTFRNN